MAWFDPAKEPEWEARAPERPATERSPDAGLEAAWRAARTFGCRFRAGLQLYLHCLWRMCRMRRVWAVLVAMAVVQTVGYWHLTQADSYIANGPTQASGAGGLFALGRAVRIAWQSGVLRVRTPDWRDPHKLGTNVLRGTSRPLNGRLGLVGDLAQRQMDRWVGQPGRYGPVPTPLSSQLATLLADLIYAALTSGILGWVLAALRGEERTRGAFARGVKQGLPLILVWFLLLDSLRFMLYGAVPHDVGNHWADLGDSLFAVFAFLGVLIPPMAVLYGSSLRSVALSVRVLGARLVMVLGFLLLFRATYDALGGVSTSITLLVSSIWVYGTRLDGVVASAMIMCVHMAASALALLISVAFTLVVLRSLPRAVAAEAAAS